MLFFEPVGPDQAGLFGAAYTVHGVIRVVVGQCRTWELAKSECDRLNEEQVVENREALHRYANLIARDKDSSDAG